MSPPTTGVYVTPDELERLIELLSDQRGDVYSGSTSGYDQSRDDELNDIDALMTKLQAAR